MSGTKAGRMTLGGDCGGAHLECGSLLPLCSRKLASASDSRRMSGRPSRPERAAASRRTPDWLARLPRLAGRGLLGALLALALLANSAFAEGEPRPNLARQRSDATAQAKGSQGWWLGTAAALVVLAGAGALCLAARGKAAGAAAARLQVLGRVHLPPRHALFLVKAGRRTLLIGTGPQGAPSLLGELDDDEAESASESIGARLEAAAASHRGPRAPARFDVQLGDEP